MKKKISRHDVARVAGVSHMTVTRAIGNFPYVSKELRRKVLAACKTLNYRPNIIASALRNRKSYAVGLIVHNFSHTFYAQLLHKVEEECRKAGYHVVVVQGASPGLEQTITRGDLEFLFARQIDGLMVAMGISPDTLWQIKRERIPTVFVDIPPTGGRFSFVGTADFDGAKQITGYFLDAGHQKIAFLAGPKGHYTSERRLAGYREALFERGIPYNRRLVKYTNYHIDGGYEACLEFLAAGERFTAVVGANDYVATGLLAACDQRGVKVPDDISVTGFTGDEIGSYTHPPLTTMRVPIDDIARKAVRMLLAAIRDPKRPVERVLVPAIFVERQSARKM